MSRWVGAAVVALLWVGLSMPARTADVAATAPLIPVTPPGAISATPALLPSTTSPERLAGLPLASGDIVRVRVYERDDLSGDFHVRDDGTVVLPLLGAFAAGGNDEARLADEIRQAVTRMATRSTDVLVEVVARRPVYIVGLVDKPGSYPYASEMTVLHVLSLAGGYYRPATLGTSSVLEVTREQSRLRTSQQTLAHALAKLARLEAERAGRSAIDRSTRLVELVGAAEAERLVAGETQVLDANAAAQRQQLEALTRGTELAREEIETLKRKIASLKTQIKLNQAELTQIQKLASMQLTRSARVLEVKNAIESLNGDTEDVVAVINRTERTIAEMLGQQASLVSTRQAQIEKDIVEARQAVAAAELELVGSRRLIGQIASVAVTETGALQEPKVRFVIVRTTRGKRERIDADELTTVLPGDVVRVIQLDETN